MPVRAVLQLLLRACVPCGPLVFRVPRPRPNDGDAVPAAAVAAAGGGGAESLAPTGPRLSPVAVQKVAPPARIFFLFLVIFKTNLKNMPLPKNFSNLSRLAPSPCMAGQNHCTPPCMVAGLKRHVAATCEAMLTWTPPRSMAGLGTPPWIMAGLASPPRIMAGLGLTKRPAPPLQSTRRALPFPAAAASHRRRAATAAPASACSPRPAPA